MKIEVVIPNYNGADLIKKNLPFVIEAVKKYESFISIVDDASDPKDFQRLKASVDSLKDISPVPIRLVRNANNLGFSGTVNRAALNSTADFLVLLNSDVKPEKDFLRSVLPRFEDGNLFAVGCMDKSIEENGVVLRGRGIGSFQKGLLVHKKGDIRHENTLWVSGGSSVMRADIFQKLNGFDTLYTPFYWEDIDLSYRALKSGYSILFDKESTVEHYHEEGAIKQHSTSTRVNRIASRNQILFMWKNITDASLLFSHFFFLPLHVTQSLISGNTAFAIGLLFAILKLPYVLNSRRQAKKTFVKNDRDVIHEFQEI